MTTVIRINLLHVLANSSNYRRARRHTVQSASKQHIHSKCYTLSLKSKYLETNLAIEMSQNNTLTNGKLWRCQTQQRNTQITAEIIQTYDLLKFALAQSNGSSFLLITQYEMPFINQSEATKRSKDQKMNGKCTNGTNCRSRVWPVCCIYIIPF